jgi:hypothetical protein
MFILKCFPENLHLKELIFTFEEREVTDTEIEYLGEIFYDGNEYIGGIYTDKRGFLNDYDFYNSLEFEGDRLQVILKDFKYELQHFFQEIVVPNLN